MRKGGFEWCVIVGEGGCVPYGAGEGVLDCMRL